MTFGTKLRLFWKLGGGRLQIALVLSALFAFDWFTRGLPPSLTWSTFFAVCFSLWAFVTVWLKFQRVLETLKDGKRVGAIVRGTTFSSSGDDSPDLYVLNWSDDDGYLGESLSAPLKAFSDVTEGQRIIVYRNTLGESWWERDVFGPVIRPNNAP